MATYSSTWRRGLPREHGGEPWPPAGLTSDVATSSAAAPESAAATEPVSASEPVQPAPARSGAPVVGGTTAVRRGLPRTPGGEPWPPADFTAAARADSAAQPESPVLTEGAARADLASAPADTTRREPGPAAEPATPDAGDRTPKAEPKRYGRFTLAQWVGGGAGVAVVLLVLATAAVLFVRWMVTLPFMQDFLTTYPGEYELPEGAPVGFPAWLNWQHFLTVFLMVLIIRSGLQSRYQKRPSAFWTPRWNKERKISLTVWFHQSLDILWLLNGVIFVILLFVSGQWMRIVPTSWEVFPNALSAVIQYVSLDWPTENGWVNFNSVQQLTYFVVVFIAAPLAAITGVRMSGLWPKNAPRLNALYPLEWARAVHFPTMIFFVLFIIVHVTLVFATGALRNLNHMYAAQGSADPTALAENWTGFWIFFASMLLIVGAWIAARPVLLAPIARLFGSVSAR